MSISVVRAASLPWSNIANEFVGDDHGTLSRFSSSTPASAAAYPCTSTPTTR